jgi:hypothetical protein
MTSEFRNLDARSVWAALSYNSRLFLLFFCGVSIYTLKMSFHVMTGLRGMKKRRDSYTGSANTSALRHFRKRLGNLRQLHLLTFYTLCLCVAFNIPSAFNTLGDSIWLVLTKFAFLCSLYARVLLAFVLLHSVQWFISSASMHSRVKTPLILRVPDRLHYRTSEY